MSVKIMAQVWELDLIPTDKLVLLAFADHTDDAGICWPSLHRIAWKSGVSKDTVRRVLARMVFKGIIEILSKGDGRGHTTRYKVSPEKGSTLLPFETERVASEEERVAPGTLKGSTAMLPESSLEPSKQESPDVVIEHKQEEIKEEPKDLPLAKPKKKEKNKKPTYRARSLDDLPSSPSIVPRPSAEADDALGVPSSWREPIRGRDLSKFYTELRKLFRREIGKSMGSLSMRAGELFCDACAEHGTAAVEKAFNFWIVAEKHFLSSIDNPQNRFVFKIEEWIAECDVKLTVPQGDDPNTGLGMSEEGRKKLERYS